jgi:antitoxin CptB
MTTPAEPLKGSLRESSHQEDPARRARLRWRARRGLLENDLIMERFFARYEDQLSDADVGAMTELLDLGDNDLMDLLLARSEPQGPLATPAVQHVLGLLRSV